MGFSSQTGSTICAPDGCFIDRLGCSSPGKINWRNMVISRKKMAYQRVGTTSSKASPPNISQEFTSIHIQMDNIVTLTYLKRMGGSKNQKMIILSKEIWEILISKQIMITVEYLTSSLNKVADLESRRKVDFSEWVLCSHVFRNLCLKLGTPTVDLFASRVSHQVAYYVVWKPDPYSIATDAMSIPWTQGHCYAFPPFCLIPRVLSIT